MAKKIRFPLEMEQGIEVRSLEELRDHFSLARVLVYVSNGKLVTWLRDRYADEVADAIEELDINDSEIAPKLCEIFDIEYDEELAINLEKAEERNRKLSILKEYTTEQRFLDAIDIVAFTQDDVYDLLDEEETTIYLCGEKFSIPLGKKGMTYIGVNNPIVVVNSKEEVNWQEKNILLKDIQYDEVYQKKLNNLHIKKQELDQRLLDKTNNKTTINNTNKGCYSRNTYLNFMLSDEDKEGIQKSYNKLLNEVTSVNYDIDANVLEIKGQLKNSGLVGLANNYIKSL